MTQIASGNGAVDKYLVPEGFPKIPSHARFIGHITGTWYEMGLQLGEKSGDLCRWVSDARWMESTAQFGVENTQEAMKLYEAQIKAFNPGLIDFMQGIAEGSASWLKESSYAAVSTDYERVLCANIYDEWSMKHPAPPYPWKTSTTVTGSKGMSSQKDENYGCSSFAVVGVPLKEPVTASQTWWNKRPTKNEETIVAHNRQTNHFPSCYEAVYIATPSDPGANTFWVLTNPPQISGNMVVNDKGLAVILTSGALQATKEGETNDFGVPWFHQFIHISANVDTPDEAVEILTKGTPEYRVATGRQTILRGGSWNFLIVDPDEAICVETTAHRYGIRRPGDAGEAGNYIVMIADQCWCNHSYDENNVLTDVPMTKFGYPGLPREGLRHPTLMWDIYNHYGLIDKELAMEFLKGHYVYDYNGTRFDPIPPADWVWGCTCHFIGTGGHTQKLGYTTGTADGKIAILRKPNAGSSTIYWTLGNPCHWIGPWDQAEF